VIAVAALLALLAADSVPIVPLGPLPDPPRSLTEDTQPRPSHPYLRTAIEDFAIIGIGAIWYWRHPSYSSWDLHFTWDDWSSKLFSDREIVLDHDLFSTNGLAHPIDGALYYQVARGNGLGPAASLIASFLTSTVWEYFGEWDEKPSTNDLIFTPAGGAVIGEATYRLGRMFAAGSPGIGNCLGALVFSPVASLAESRVCRSAANEPLDEWGLPLRVWHHLGFDLGQAWSSFNQGAATSSMALGLTGIIVDHSDYRRPGRSGPRPVSPGDWSALSFGALLSEPGVRGLGIHAEGAWWGRYLRDFAEPEHPGQRETDGWGLMLGLGSTFDYETRQLPTEWDRQTNAGLVGPMVELTNRRGDLDLRAFLTVQYGFGMVSSLAYPAIATAVQGAVIKTELKQQGYYYAQSVSGTAAASAADGPFEICLRVHVAAYWSINQDDRYQGEITDNFSLSDQRVYLRAAGALRVFGGPLRVALALDQIDRTSQVPGFHYKSVERRAGLSALVVF
jgi:hypothetical protein